MQTLSLEDFQELQIDESELRQVQDTYATLEGYYGEISKAGLVDRSQAQALVESCGVSFEHRPLNSFTTFPTTVNYDVAMEGIGESAMRLMGELIKKAVALLVKIAQWMVDIIKKRKYRDRQAGVVARNVGLISQANHQLKSLGVETVETPVSVRDKMNDYVERIDHAYSAYYNSFSQLSSDVLNNGPVSGAVRNFNLVFSPLADLVNNKIALFDEIVRTHPRAGHETGALMSMKAQLKTVGTPYPLTPFTSIAAGTNTSVAGSGDVLDYLNRFYTELALMRTTVLPAEEAVSVDAAVQRMTNNRLANTLPYRVDPDSQDRKLTKAKNELQRLQQIHPSQQAPDDVRELMQAAVLCIQREVMALERIVVLSETLSFEYDRLLTAVLSVALHEHNHLAARGSMATQPEMHQQSQQIAVDLKRDLK